MQIPSRGYYPSSPRNVYLRLCKWKRPRNTKSSRQCECGRKNLFTVEVVLESVPRMKWSRTFAWPFSFCFVLRNWMNHRCWIEKRDANFLSLLCLHCIPFLMRLSGRRRDTTPKINTDAFYIYSRFLSAALAINPHWPQVWCSINTTTHAQTRTRVAGSIAGCFQTSFLTF